MVRSHLRDSVILKHLNFDESTSYSPVTENEGNQIACTDMLLGALGILETERVKKDGHTSPLQ